VSVDGIAETLNGLNAIETPTADAALPFDGVITNVPEAPLCGAAAAFGVSVSVPDACPVVPASGDTPSHAGAPLTVNACALPSLALTVTTLAGGFPLPVYARKETFDGFGATVTVGVAEFTVKVTPIWIGVHELGVTQLIISDPIYVFAARPAGFAVTVIGVPPVVAVPVSGEAPSQLPLLDGTIW
jgi:hypothetical protein